MGQNMNVLMGVVAAVTPICLIICRWTRTLTQKHSSDVLSAVVSSPIMVILSNVLQRFSETNLQNLDTEYYIECNHFFLLAQISQNWIIYSAVSSTAVYSE